MTEQTLVRRHAYPGPVDLPTIGPATLEAMATGGATALAVEGGKVLIVDREATVRFADKAGITIVSSDLSSSGGHA